MIDNKIYDTFFKLKGNTQAPSEIVIAAIDERSIANLGRWPWSRDKIAKLIDKLSAMGASVIALDIIYSEKEAHDPVLKESIYRAGNVFLPVVFMFEQEGQASRVNLHEFALPVSQKTQNGFAPISAPKVLTPLKELMEVATGLAHINIFPDEDGVIRWEALYIEYQGYLIPVLSLRVATYHLGIPEDRIMVQPGIGIYWGRNFVPTDKHGRTLIYYYGGNNHFKHLSIVDILNGYVNPEEIEGKIVLVGATAVGIYDLRVTPMSPALPGVEKHAHMIASLLEGKYIYPSPLSYVILTILLSGIFGISFVKLRALHALLVFGCFLVLLLLLSFYLLAYKGFWLPPSGALLNMLLQFAVITPLRYSLFEREANFIRKVFSNYVTEKVLQELIRNPSLTKLGGERKEITVLFSDLRGFTSLSEKLPPEEVVELLNEYFLAMTEVVFKWDGTLDKFIGDAIMAFWGAPLEVQDHPKKAVNCAVEMALKLRELNKKWASQGKPELHFGVGINTGIALVGNIGAEGKKMDYTVIGDTVNLASRLEGLNKQYNSEIIISEDTYNHVKNFMESQLKGKAELLFLGEVTVKGKERPVKIYQVRVLD